jgi:DNA-binding transcriptional LysR family regulator
VRQIAEEMLRLNDRLGALAQDSKVPTFRLGVGVIDDQALPFNRSISCNNMAALAHLAGRGMGVTILPRLLPPDGDRREAPDRGDGNVASPP